VPATTFPQAYGMAETWDPDLLHQAGAIEGCEARYVFQSPKYGRGGLVVRAPNADLGRDPHWGRTEECYGEDPFFNGTMVVAFIRGLQGDDPRYLQTASMLKHFFANSMKTAATVPLLILTSNFSATIIRFRSAWDLCRAGRAASWRPTTPGTEFPAPSSR
jgi:beta-glucosidase